MSENKKDTAKWRVAIIGIGFVLGVALLLFGGGGSSGEEPKIDGTESYRAALEDELEALCEAMVGADVQVFVSLESGFSYNYALDSRGGVVTVGSGSSESALIENTFMPAVSGVGVVYSCAQSAVLEERLSSLLSSALGIGTNKIFIIGSKKSTDLS